MPGLLLLLRCVPVLSIALIWGCGNTAVVETADDPRKDANAKRVVALKLGAEAVYSKRPKATTVLTEPFKYIAIQKYVLVLEKPMTLSNESSVSSKCDDMTVVHGPFFKYEASDGSVVTTDRVDNPAFAIDKLAPTEVFPAGQVKVTLSFYSSAPCSSLELRFKLSEAS